MQNASGPGFESQVPQIFHIFCLFRIQCIHKPRVYHVTSRSSLPSGQMAKSDGHPGGNTKSQVKRVALDLASQRGLQIVGPRKCFLHPSKCYIQAHSLFLFSFLFYFISFNSFIYLQTNQIIFFFIKKSQIFFF